MKKIILTITAVCVFGIANAQKKFEAKINPLGAFFGRPDISGEYIFTDHFAAELTLGVAFGKSTIDGTVVQYNVSEKPDQSGFGIKAAAKYYFNPDEGADGWYGGLYIRQESLNLTYSVSNKLADYSTSIFAGGVEVGKKWVWDSGFLIELGFGVGRPFSETRKFTNRNMDYDLSYELNVDYTGKLAVGYRF